MVYPLLGGLAVFVSIVSLYVWATGGRTAGPEARLKQLNAQPRRAIDSPFSDRVLVPVLDSFTRFIVQLLPQKFVTRISRQLVAAGRPMSTQAFFTTLVVTSTLVPFAMLSLVLLSNDGSLSLIGGALVCGRCRSRYFRAAYLASAPGTGPQDRHLEEPCRRL